MRTRVLDWFAEKVLSARLPLRVQKESSNSLIRRYEEDLRIQLHSNGPERTSLPQHWLKLAQEILGDENFHQPREDNFKLILILCIFQESGRLIGCYLPLVHTRLNSPASRHWWSRSERYVLIQARSLGNCFYLCQGSVRKAAIARISSKKSVTENQRIFSLTAKKVLMPTKMPLFENLIAPKAAATLTPEAFTGYLGTIRDLDARLAFSCSLYTPVQSQLSQDQTTISTGAKKCFIYLIGTMPLGRTVAFLNCDRHFTNSEICYFSKR